MSATATRLDRLPPLPIATEQYACPCCDCVIPQHHVFSRFLFEGGAVRSITVYCEHCRVYYKRDFELRGGVWCPTGNPEMETNAKRVAALQKIVNRIANTQLAQSA